MNTKIASLALASALALTACSESPAPLSSAALSSPELPSLEYRQYPKMRTSAEAALVDDSHLVEKQRPRLRPLHEDVDLSLADERQANRGPARGNHGTIPAPTESASS